MSERGLRQLAALLVALAALAERAAGRCLPLRWLLLVLLRRAENVATTLLARTSGWERSDIESELDAASAGDGPTDAMALARRLRLLSELFVCLLPPDGLPGSGAEDGRASAADAAAALVQAWLRAAACAFPYPAADTS